MPAYFNNTIYYGAANDALKAFSVNNARLVSDPASQSAGPSPILDDAEYFRKWHIGRDRMEVENNGGSSVHAYDATNLANELYNSTQAGTKTSLSRQFITPMIAKRQSIRRLPTGVIVFALLN